MSTRELMCVSGQFQRSFLHACFFRLFLPFSVCVFLSTDAIACCPVVSRLTNLAVSENV